MSLDVYLKGSAGQQPCVCGDCGNKHTVVITQTFFQANITHNLNHMAEAAGIYKELWRPEEIGIRTARQLIEPLRAGLMRLKADPSKFKAFDDDGGWGTYDQFVPWIEEYLRHCEEYPDATVRVSR